MGPILWHDSCSLKQYDSLLVAEEKEKSPALQSASVFTRLCEIDLSSLSRLWDIWLGDSDPEAENQALDSLTDTYFKHFE